MFLKQDYQRTLAESHSTSISLENFVGMIFQHTFYKKKMQFSIDFTVWFLVTRISSIFFF